MGLYFDYPMPTRSIATLACSLLAGYGLSTPNPTLPEVDECLVRAPRNVVLLLLDGLGYDILRRHLPANAFLCRHLFGTLSSVFPPTTAAAATALESGLFPAQSGWLGWSVYWPELHTNVNLYPNTTSDGIIASKEHLGRTYLGFPTLVQRIGKETKVSSAALSGELGTCTALLEGIGALCRQPGQHFIYAYLDQPDSLLHKKGCTSEEVTEFLHTIDRWLEDAFRLWPETLLFLTADHGFTDVEGLCLKDFPDLDNTLTLLPSIEPRAMNCFVKPGQQQVFRDALHRATRGTYTLYSREEVCQMALFGPGPEHPRFQAMLGDYLAVARTPLTLFPNRSYLSTMVAGHGGMTPGEITVPLILAQNRD